MQKITLLGTGAMGSRMATKLFDSGYKVTVWNRTTARTKELVNKGITSASTPQEAVADADVVISMVRDDEASHSVWLDEQDGALSAMKKDAIGIECSTLSTPYVNKLAGVFQKQNIAFLDAPVAGSRPQAEAGKLIFFVGGKNETLEVIEPTLKAMGQAVHHAGKEGAGTITKLMINSLFGIQLATIAELLGLAHRTDIEMEKVVEIIKSTPVCSPAAGIAASAMLEHAFATAFPIDLVFKDFQLIHKSSASLNRSVPLSECATKIYQQAVEKGFDGDNITGVYKLYIDSAKEIS